MKKGSYKSMKEQIMEFRTTETPTKPNPLEKILVDYMSYHRNLDTWAYHLCSERSPNCKISNDKGEVHIYYNDGLFEIERDGIESYRDGVTETNFSTPNIRYNGHIVYGRDENGELVYCPDMEWIKELESRVTSLLSGRVFGSKTRMVSHDPTGPCNPPKNKAKPANSMLDTLCEKIKDAKSPEEIFGKINEADSIIQLKKIYYSILTEVHPDKYPDDLQKSNATQATITLIAHYKQAQEAIQKGSYGTKAKKKPVKDEIKFSVNGYNYAISDKIIEGDFCKVYFGERTKEGQLEKICLKATNDEQDGHLLINEYDLLKKLNHQSIPTALDSFELDGKRANILKRIEDSYDLIALREHFPNGFPQEHTVWIFDRLLSVLGYIHKNLTIHGSIEPGNIIITPQNHNGLLIDYLFAIPDADKKDAKYVGVNDYSAPELGHGAIPHPSSDMFSLGKSMLFLLGGDLNRLELPKGIDPRLARFIQGFLELKPEIRTNDAWKAWHELKELRKKIYGAPSQFLELKL